MLVPTNMMRIIREYQAQFGIVGECRNDALSRTMLTTDQGFHQMIDPVAHKVGIGIDMHALLRMEMADYVVLRQFCAKRREERPNVAPAVRHHTDDVRTLPIRAEHLSSLRSR